MIISELSLLLEYIHHNGWWDIRYLNDVPGKNQMSQSHYSTSTLFLEKLLRLLIILSIGLTALVACRISSREYTTDDQYALARSRIDNMKEQLDFSFSLEKDSVHVSEKIFFVAHFTNATNKPVTLRVPQQSGLLDINHPNATLVYSISPMDKTISISTSLSGLGTVYIPANPVQSKEFEILNAHGIKDVRLELPNIVYLKQEDNWVESVLPAGQYLVHMSYENLYIGYEIEKEAQSYFIDKSAWVGQIDTKAVLLTISP